MNQLHYEADLQLSQERKALSLLSKTLDKNTDRGPGYTLAGVSVKLASMWLGKAKGALGIKTPYPESFDPKSPVIENQSDESFDELVLPKDADNVGKIKFFRSELNKLELSIANDSKIMPEHKAYQFCIANALTYCCEATMWLGDTLNDLKSKQPAKVKKEEKPTPKKLTSVIDTEFPKFDPKAEVGAVAPPSDYINEDMGRVSTIEPVETPETPAPTADKGGPGQETPTTDHTPSAPFTQTKTAQGTSKVVEAPPSKIK